MLIIDTIVDSMSKDGAAQTTRLLTDEMADREFGAAYRWFIEVRNVLTHRLYNYITLP